MTTLAELKTKADNLGIDRGIVRLYGDLRKISTWEQAITSHQTVTVEAETIDEPETVEEIIPFTPNDDHPSRREMALEELDRMRKVFEPAGVDCPPPPPIVRPCPMPESPGIPGIEIAERDQQISSPIPGSDRRVKSLGDRLAEKIKLDVFKYLDSLKEWVFDYYVNFAYLIQYDYLCSSYEIDKFQAIHKPEKIIVYEFINQAIALVTTIKQNHIPWYLQQDMPKQPIWFDTKQDDYFLILEKPEPIPLLSCHYDGEFIPNCFHEMGTDIYCFRFPNQLRAEEYFEMITQADKYQFIPASQPQLLLAGV